MGRRARKTTLWTLRKVSTRISLIMPSRLPRIDTVRLLRIFCFRNHNFTPIPHGTEYVGTDLSAQTAQAGLGRYITQCP